MKIRLFDVRNGREIERSSMTKNEITGEILRSCNKRGMRTCAYHRTNRRNRPRLTSLFAEMDGWKDRDKNYSFFF